MFHHQCKSYCTRCRRRIVLYRRRNTMCSVLTSLYFLSTILHGFEARPNTLYIRENTTWFFLAPLNPSRRWYKDQRRSQISYTDRRSRKMKNFSRSRTWQAGLHSCSNVWILMVESNSSISAQGSSTGRHPSKWPFCSSKYKGNVLFVSNGENGGN